MAQLLTAYVLRESESPSEPIYLSVFKLKINLCAQHGEENLRL